MSRNNNKPAANKPAAVVAEVEAAAIPAALAAALAAEGIDESMIVAAAEVAKMAPAAAAALPANVIQALYNKTAKVTPSADDTLMTAVRRCGMGAKSYRPVVISRGDAILASPANKREALAADMLAFLSRNVREALAKIDAASPAEVLAVMLALRADKAGNSDRNASSDVVDAERALAAGKAVRAEEVAEKEAKAKEAREAREALAAKMAQ